MTTEDEQVDDALLADVTGFLADCRVPAPGPDPQLHPRRVLSGDGLLLATHELLAETETLLSSLDTDHQQTRTSPTAPSVSAYASTKAEQLSAQERRELRNAQAAKRRLRYRQKLKDERETLQQQEVEMSSMLSRLQNAREAEKRSQVDNISLSVWKAIATRQKEKRLEAEQTQRQLRAAVVGRARMVRQMNSLLQRPHKDEEKKSLCEEKGGVDGAVLFETFVAELDAIYAQTDEVMREANFRISPKLEYKPERTSKHGVEFFDSADASEIPYAYEDTSRAVSLIMLTGSGGSRDSPEALEAKDTATLKYNVNCQLERGESAHLTVYSAVKKFQEADRLVFVWRALTEGQHDLSGHHTDETGWLVLRAEQVGGFPSTVLECYVRFIPMNVSGTVSNKVGTDRFVEVVAKTGEEEVNEMMQMLEKMLLGDDRLSSNGSPSIRVAP
ncbi:hypothetical protein PHYPSEUDO_002088 [Phytophthora pseudosyringae]|uniref:BZIP domain-containing protein n=1 Tax=Phytophthora pseudosyringae TaxID=221518 RepID=A0A8T1VU23_9STRA|nr:hypothetical protein PHYPSEUDO_002088 [Phytophthora pseudosyringae]